MKKQLKAMNKLAVSGLGLGAMNVAGSAMGSSLVGNLTQGYGAMLPATGAMLGASMAIESIKLIKKK